MKTNKTELSHMFRKYTFNEAQLHYIFGNGMYFYIYVQHASKTRCLANLMMLSYVDD